MPNKFSKHLISDSLFHFKIISLLFFLLYLPNYHHSNTSTKNIAFDQKHQHNSSQHGRYPKTLDIQPWQQRARGLLHNPQLSQTHKSTIGITIQNPQPSTGSATMMEAIVVDGDSSSTWERGEAQPVVIVAATNWGGPRLAHPHP